MIDKEPRKGFNMSDDKVWCDNCGDLVAVGGESVGVRVWTYGRLPFPIASANVGESAVLCDECDSHLWGEMRWKFGSISLGSEPKFLAEGSVTLNGEPIAEDELPNWLRGQNYNRVWFSHEPDPIPTVQIGGSSVAQGLGKYLAEMSESDRVKRKQPLLWGYREPSHVRWDEVLEFSRQHPQAWHEVRDRFDRKPRWKK